MHTLLALLLSVNNLTGSQPFFYKIMGWFRICVGSDVPHAKEWLMWLGVGIAGYVLLCLFLVWLTGIEDGKYPFFHYLQLPFTTIAPALIPLGLMSYMWSNMDYSSAIWFMNDANGYGWIGYIVWCIVCYIGVSLILDAVKALFTFWRRNIIITVVYVIGGIAWSFMFFFALLQIVYGGNDFLILCIFVTLASMAGGGYRAVTKKGTLIDDYGQEVLGTFDGNRFYGNDGNTYSKNNHDEYHRD